MVLPLILLALLIPSWVGAQSAPYPASTLISGVTWDCAGEVTGAEGSDLFPATWHSDGHIYLPWGDGWGFSAPNGSQANKSSVGISRLTGGPTNIGAQDILCDNSSVCANSPSSISINPDSWSDASNGGKITGIISVSGTLYGWETLQDGSFPNVTYRLVWSTNNGANWNVDNETFPAGAGNFKPRSFVNFGQSNAGARDGFIYFTGHEQWSTITDLNDLFMGRVPAGNIESKGDYEYFSGTAANPSWSSNIADRTPIFTDPANVTRSIHISYNPGIQRYLLMTSHFDNGTEEGDQDPGLFEAPEPWGPWRTIQYITGSWCGYSGELSLGFAIPTKTPDWMSTDGTVFHVIWSGANSSVLDKYHQIKGTLTLASEPTGNVINAASGSPTDLSNAINQASNGDTVVIPAGTFTFNSRVITGKSIHLKGAGRDSTILRRTSGSTPQYEGMIQFNNADNVEFSDITLEGFAVLNSRGTSHVGLGLHQCQDFNVHNARFESFYGAGMRVTGPSARGVVHHNEFINNFMAQNGSPTYGYGIGINALSDALWQVPLELGTANNVFVEDNFFTGSKHAITGGRGARFVARHNDIEEGANNAIWQIDMHGQRHSSQESGRSFEIYNNRIRRDGGSTNIGIRGGDGVIFNNDLNGAIHVRDESCPNGGCNDPDTEILHVWNNDIQTFQQTNDTDIKLVPLPGYTPYTYPHPLVTGADPGPDPTPSLSLVKAYVLRTDLQNVYVRLSGDSSGVNVAPATGFSLEVEASPVTISAASCVHEGLGISLCTLTHNGMIDAASDVVTLSYSRSLGNVVDAVAELDELAGVAVKNWYAKVWNTDALIAASTPNDGRPVSALFDDDFTSEESSMVVSPGPTMFVEFDTINPVHISSSIVAGDAAGNFQCFTYDVQAKMNAGDLYTLVVDNQNCNQRELITRLFAAPTEGRFWRITFTGPSAGVQAMELEGGVVGIDPPEPPDPSSSFGPALEGCHTTTTDPSAITLNANDAWETTLFGGSGGQVYLLDSSAGAFVTSTGLLWRNIKVYAENCEPVVIDSALPLVLGDNAVVAGLTLDFANTTNCIFIEDDQVSGDDLITGTIVRNNHIFGGTNGNCLTIESNVQNILIQGNIINGGGLNGDTVAVLGDGRNTTCEGNEPDNIVIRRNKIMKDETAIPGWTSAHFDQTGVLLRTLAAGAVTVDRNWFLFTPPQGKHMLEIQYSCNGESTVLTRNYFQGVGHRASAAPCALVHTAFGATGMVSRSAWLGNVFDGCNAEGIKAAVQFGESDTDVITGVFAFNLVRHETDD